MPSIMPDELEKIATALLVEAGASEEESKVISRLSIGANLAGHDSHGIIQIPTYIDRVNRGHIVPGAEYEIVKDTPTTTVVDGHWGFGYSVTERLMRETIEKARTQNIAAATVYRQSHIGRLAAYPLMAAEADMIGMITADSGRSAKAVVPFGGREKRLGTNPISIAMPSNLDGPFFLDMATSAVAAGKINLAQARGGSIPSGWVVKADGEHTTDPNELKNGGAILPLGGDQGHKGYGLSSIVEIFSGILTGLGFGHDPSGRHNDGCFISVFNVSAFRDL
ncbi:MAG: Ldh family oxidoreductase, partial [SAR202 cluster bacterium]